LTDPGNARGVGDVLLLAIGVDIGGKTSGTGMLGGVA